MKRVTMMLGVFLALSAKAELKYLDNVQEFETLVNTSTVPVMVAFSAYWCGPCKNLEAVMKRVATQYNDDEVIIAKVDAYVNTALKKYLQGGYPTVRTFYSGQLAKKSFSGSNSETYVRQFVDDLIAHPVRGGEGLGELCPVALP